MGGDPWKAFAAGAIGGAFGAWGFGMQGLVGAALGAASGGALGALITGDDVGRAAITAAAVAVTVEVCFKAPTNPASADSVEGQHLQEVKATNGTSSSGTSYEWDAKTGEAVLNPEYSSPGYTLEYKYKQHFSQFLDEVQVEDKGFIKRQLDEMCPFGGINKRLEEASKLDKMYLDQTMKTYEDDIFAAIDAVGKGKSIRAGAIHSRVAEAFDKAGYMEAIGKGAVEDGVSYATGKGFGKLVDASQIPKSEIGKSALKRGWYKIYGLGKKGIKRFVEWWKGPKPTETTTPTGN